MHEMAFELDFKYDLYIASPAKLYEAENVLYWRTKAWNSHF